MNGPLMGGYRGLNMGRGMSGATPVVPGQPMQNQSNDLYSKMRGTGGAPNYQSLMRAAIQQRRMSRPGAQPTMQGTPQMNMPIKGGV